MLKFSNKVVGTVQVPMKITEDDICNIIVSCFEGGSNYWLGLENDNDMFESQPEDEPTSTWATKLLLDGKTLKFYDIEQTEDDSNWTLTLEKLLEGIKLNAINRSWASDKDNWDATDCDCIIQYAMFGKVVFC